MLTLGLYSSSLGCSVAAVEGDKILSSDYDEVNKGAEGLLPLIIRVLSSGKTNFEQIDKVAVCNGPGSFTGIRTSLSLALGICHSKAKELIPIPLLPATLVDFTSQGRETVTVAVVIENEGVNISAGYKRRTGISGESFLGVYRLRSPCQKAGEGRRPRQKLEELSPVEKIESGDLQNKISALKTSLNYEAQIDIFKPFIRHEEMGVTIAKAGSIFEIQSEKGLYNPCYGNDVNAKTLEERKKT